MLDTLVEARERGFLAGGVVVHRPEGSLIRDLAVAAGFDAVLAERAGAGISESLKAGIVALKAATTRKTGTAALVCLADQPLLSTSTIAALVAAADGSDSRLIRPRYVEGPAEPGHPVLIGRAHWDLVAETRGDRGLEPVLEAHALAWRVIDVAGANPDVDTPDDLSILDPPS